MDRRIARTRQTLQEALLDLLREQPFEAIEIQAITERAGTARVTFYRHYGTKEELLVDAIARISGEMQATLQTMSSVEHILDYNREPPAQVLFDYLALDRPLYRRLLTGSMSALVQQQIRHYTVQHVLMTFASAPRYADLPVALIANHIASCLVGNIMWWLAEDVPYSAEYMARITHWMALAGAMTFVGRGDELVMPPPDAWRVPDEPKN